MVAKTEQKQNGSFQHSNMEKASPSTIGMLKLAF